ncbi:PREDICTED: cell adhesion molecule 3-like [Priapulus caudatus]|uniref:Cell adhesion molecule 3-like n=1 Tax=Priapulus caudatus TaxID=37621 RepID=A0ABM1DUC5_PRICU|nr:PREDICTED: cell adhesion molecule 3-like [Priapulus caudatus]
MTTAALPVCCVIVVVLLATYARGQFVEQPTSSPVTALREGNDVELRCVIEPTFDGVAATGALWYRRDRQQYINVRSASRYRYVDASHENGDWSLLISNTTIDDNGYYYCQWSVFGGDFYDSSAVMLTIVMPPENISLYYDTVATHGEVALAAFEPENFTCIVANSNPAASVTWTLDGRDVSEHANVTLTVGETQQLTTTTSRLSYAFHPDDNGALLRCDALVSADEFSLAVTDNVEERLQVTVNVYYLNAIVNVLSASASSALAEGERMELRCEARGNPPPRVTWHFTPTDGDDTTLWTDNERLLVVDGVTRENSGEYWCEVDSSVAQYASVNRVAITVAVESSTTRVAATVVPIIVVILVAVLIVAFMYVKKMLCFESKKQPDEEKVDANVSYRPSSGVYNYAMDSKAKVPDGDNEASIKPPPSNEDTKMCSTPDKLRKDLQKHPLATEFESVYRVRRASETGEPIADPRSKNVENLNYANLELSNANGRTAAPKKEDEPIIYVVVSCPLLSPSALSGLVNLRQLQELELTNCPGASHELYEYFCEHMSHCLILE